MSGGFLFCRIPRCRVAFGVCLASVLVSICAPLRGEEPFLPFLQGLVQRGYYETALDYLTTMEDSPLASTEQRELIPLERAVTLIAYSRTQRDIERRLELLGQGEQQLQQFVDSKSGHPKLFAARSELANTIVERARIKLEQSKLGDSAILVPEARDQFQRGIDELKKLETLVTAELDQIPKVLDTKDRAEVVLAKRRTQLRADNLQTELLAAAIREELAGTFDSGSTQRVEQLAAAAEQYESIYKKYRSRLAGLYARMYQGRCNAQMGKTKDALAYYGDLLDQPDEPLEMRRLKTETLRLAMDSWLAPSERKYLVAIKQANRWIETVPRSFQRDADMLAIRLGLARALQMQAQDFSSRGMNQAVITQSLAAARDHAEFVAGEEGALQEAALQLAEELGSQRLDGGPQEPASFAEAAQAGRQFLNQLGPLTNQILVLQQKLQVDGDSSDKQEQLTSAQQKLVAAKESALASYRLAMALADESTPPSELNLARYFLCYLYSIQGDPMRAAVVGEFMARQHPESDGALQCAKIALASYNQLFADAAASMDRSFELRRIYEATVYLAKTWPNSPDAVEVLAVAVPTMANFERVEWAQQLTELIPEDSPARWQADLITGHALRGQYVRRQRALQASAEKSNPEVVENQQRLLSDGQSFLVSGFERLPDNPVVNAFNVTAMLLTAEVLLEASQPVRAVEVLEHPTLGPVTLINTKHAAVSDPLLTRQTLQIALRSYVASIDQNAEMVAKAKAVMGTLQQAVGTDSQAKQQMVAIYVQLARSIETQMKAADGEGKQQLSKVFEAFLTELAADATDTGVLLWVAETYVSLGAGFDDNPESLQPVARRYYEQAAVALDHLLTVASADPILVTQIQARLAGVKTLQRDFAGALEDYRQLLQAKPNAVNLQVEAARLLARWGKFDSSQYQRAITGVGEKPNPIIWGWAKIAAATMSHTAFRETFYEARYEVARCDAERAKTLRGVERERLLTEASKALRTTQQLYPGLAQTKWSPLYSSLEKQIESLR
ncbi:MAG: hypothetical protein P1U77_18440 [Rubripirellula sp.]|nr:hypothetical protein [Rubripirellula sp.]